MDPLTDADGEWLIQTEQDLDEQARTWSHAYPSHAYYWITQGWTLAEAVIWHRAGFDPDAARAWRDGLPNMPCDILGEDDEPCPWWIREQWAASIARENTEFGFGPGEYFEDTVWKLGPAVVREWLDAGFDMPTATRWLHVADVREPLTARHLQDAGWTPEEVDATWRTQQPRPAGART